MSFTVIALFVEIVFWKTSYCDIIFPFCFGVEFRELWNSTAVDSIDEGKIEEYLKKQGISSMQDFGMKKFVSLFCYSQITVLPRIKQKEKTTFIFNV